MVQVGNHVDIEAPFEIVQKQFGRAILPRAPHFVFRQRVFRGEAPNNGILIQFPDTPIGMHINNVAGGQSRQRIERIGSPGAGRDDGRFHTLAAQIGNHFDVEALFEIVEK